MKKSFLSLFTALTLVATMTTACSNLNRQTPAGLDNAAIKTEVRKNLTTDGITGIEIDVDGGVVTLTGHLSAEDKQKALDDARKVNGVTSVVDKIAVH
jgi:osmotically-inducible protein OsmY